MSNVPMTDDELQEAREEAAEEQARNNRRAAIVRAARNLRDATRNLLGSDVEARDAWRALDAALNDSADDALAAARRSPGSAPAQEPQNPVQCCPWPAGHCRKDETQCRGGYCSCQCDACYRADTGVERRSRF